MNFDRNVQIDQPEVEKPVSSLEQELIKRGVTPNTAKEFLEQYAQIHIEEKIELHDWLVSHGDKRIKKNPAGYLVEAIKNNYTPPAGFETKAQAEARQKQELEAQERAKQAEERMKAKDNEEFQRRQETVEQFLKGKTPEEKQQILEQALAQANSFQRKFAHRQDQTGEGIRQLLLYTFAIKNQPKKPAFLS